MNQMRGILPIFLLLCGQTFSAEQPSAPKPARPAGNNGQLYTQEGIDPTYAEILGSGKLAQGVSSSGGVVGSKIHVIKELVEVGPYAKRAIPKDIFVHTLADSHIPRKDFPKWSRWYQEDGNTQVFRLFKDETNVHNARALAARVEAYSGLKWKEGAWHEWSGTYTIVKPHGCAIFQVKNNINDWAIQLDMDENGDVIYSPRHEKKKVIAANMTGKPLNIRVRDNGLNYEVFLNDRQVGSGSYPRKEGETNFRWGMYLGEHPVKHDAMIFVTGAAFE